MSEKTNPADETELTDDELNQADVAGAGPHVRVFDGATGNVLAPEDTSTSTTNVEYTLRVTDTETGSV